MKNLTKIALSLLLMVALILPSAVLAAPSPTNVHIYKVKSNTETITTQDHDGSQITDLEGTFGSSELIPNVQFDYVKLTDDELAAIMTGDMVLDPAIQKKEDITAAAAWQQAVTGADGIAHVNALDEGHYLFIEKVPATVTTSAANIFVLSLPFTNTEGTQMTDIHVYPKNFLKDVERPVKSIVEGDAQNNYQVGSKFQYSVTQTVPAGIEEYTFFGLYDQMPEEVTFLEAELKATPESVTLIKDTDYTVQENVKTSDAAHPYKGKNADIKDDYNGILISMTPAGIQKLKDQSVTSIEALYTVRVNDKALGEGAVNRVFLTWSTPQNEKPDYPGDEEEVKFSNGVAHFFKHNLQDAGLEGAIFQLDAATFSVDGENQKDAIDAFVRANLKWAQEAGKTESSLVTADGTAITEANLSTITAWDQIHLKSDETGHFSIAGLHKGKEYKITEVKAPVDYEIPVNAEVTFTNDDESGFNSPTAVGLTQIVNYKHFSPSTGDIGMGIFGAIGATFLLLSVYFFRKRSTVQG